MLNVSLNDQDKAILRRIISDYAQTGNLKNKASIYVSVSSSNTAIVAENNIIYLPFHFLCEPYILERVALVTENASNDGAVIVSILRNIARRQGLGGVNFELCNGGGSTIDVVCRNLLHENRLITVIIDSDFDVPSFKLPPTANKLNKVFAEKETPLAFLTVLPCREIENIISPHIVEALSCSVEKQEVFQAIKRISDGELHLGADVRHGRFWRYFDTKQGISQEKIDRMAEPDLKWIKSRLDIVECDIMQGISDKIIQSLLSDGRAMMQLASEVVKPEWWQEFGACLSLSLWSGVAAQRVRT